MSEKTANKHDEKQQALKHIIKELHSGVPADKLKKDFAKLIKHTSPDEIADMENALIKEGFPPEEIQRLCDVHAQVFEQSLKKTGKSSRIPGHPIYTFFEENKEAKRILKQLIKSVKKLHKSQYQEKDIQSFKDQFVRLRQIEIHYQRKENQLFPLLEAKKFTGPTQVMWGKHDEIRKMLRELEGILKDQKWNALSRAVQSLSSSIKKLIFLEEKILFPTSFKKLNTQEWAQIKMGEPEIGYAWVKPSNLWDAQLAKAMKSNELKPAEQNESVFQGGDKIHLSQGQLTLEQIDLMLKNLPVDITFVDENDKVCYYSDTKDRIFPRSPAIIGRAVQNCHPPKSVNIVENIVKNFKDKKKDKAEFWIQMESRLIYIRYFPVYDAQGAYKGVVEVSQEVSQIQKLEGERRLLDW
jgi:DUF438 domain-containing protein